MRKTQSDGRIFYRRVLEAYRKSEMSKSLLGELPSPRRSFHRYWYTSSICVLSTYCVAYIILLVLFDSMLLIELSNILPSLNLSP
jgi:hypothetical protein